MAEEKSNCCTCKAAKWIAELEQRIKKLEGKERRGVGWVRDAYPDTYQEGSK